jgi:hypothetical protein
VDLNKKQKKKEGGGGAFWRLKNIESFTALKQARACKYENEGKQPRWQALIFQPDKWTQKKEIRFCSAFVWKVVVVVVVVVVRGVLCCTSNQCVPLQHQLAFPSGAFAWTVENVDPICQRSCVFSSQRAVSGGEKGARALHKDTHVVATATNHG